jgi:hypothetical protein
MSVWACRANDVAVGLADRSCRPTIDRAPYSCVNSPGAPERGSVMVQPDRQERSAAGRTAGCFGRANVEAAV